MREGERERQKEREKGREKTTEAERKRERGPLVEWGWGRGELEHSYAVKVHLTVKICVGWFGKFYRSYRGVAGTGVKPSHIVLKVLGSIHTVSIRKSPRHS